MNVLDFFNFLSLHTNSKKKIVAAAGVLNGLCMAALMYSLQIGITVIALDSKVSLRGFLLFGCSWALYYLTMFYATRTVSGITCTAIEDLELRLVNKLRRIDYPEFKKISSVDIYAALGGDKSTVLNAARLLVTAFSSSITVVLAFGYMLYISVTSVVLILALFVVLAFFYRLQNSAMAKRAEMDSQTSGVFMSSLEDLVSGFAEMKMNNLKSEDFYNRKLKPASNSKTESYRETGNHWVKMLIFNQTALYIALGLIVFIAPVLAQTTSQEVIRLLAITLMIIGPAGTIVGLMGAADLANNTLRKVWDIEKRIDEAAGNMGQDLSIPPSPPDFSTLKIEKLKFSYNQNGNGNGFTLTVKDFQLNKGELIIIRGGNGSGKTTFMHLLAGLLLPREGEILVDGVPASSMKSADYRSMFSIIFSDFCLFDSFYGFEANKDDLDYWVRKLGLVQQMKYYDSKNILPTRELSTGQRKRMALLSAILEKKSVLLLDEVAADFDPEFRSRYYREIMPELKAAGRTLLLVSHDDRYFDIADRVVEFNEGVNVS